jgi:hypothetical protein
MDGLEQAYLERLQDNDHSAFGLGDTIDAKAGLALIVVVFLADQTAAFLMSSQLTQHGHVAQWIASMALALAGGCCIAAMWPRDYASEDAMGWDGWIKKLRDNHPGDDAAVARAFFDGRVKLIKERITENRRICKAKGRLVHAAFWLSAAALALNLATSVWGWS